MTDGEAVGWDDPNRLFEAARESKEIVVFGVADIANIEEQCGCDDDNVAK
ncbi:MAG: hypothetical protein JO199_05690 [Candidatus Eremiobacteraeota bacterium]|nr:hypothetical protein [Candidatus Eremiobacteraeota bacterium]